MTIEKAVEGFVEYTAMHGGNDKVKATTKLELCLQKTRVAPRPIVTGLQKP